VVELDEPKELLKDVGKSLAELRRHYPRQMEPFSSFLKTVEEKGALDTKTKELISIALGIATRCKWCIAFHVKNALEAGATKDEIMEACFVAVLMAGAPALMT
jgi:AhpD family alkylhydroperoxidase